LIAFFDVFYSQVSEFLDHIFLRLHNELAILEPTYFCRIRLNQTAQAHLFLTVINFSSVGFSIPVFEKWCITLNENRK
jgi:hypothetical protein